ncbi:unnamed protein product [Medioppia subpectinata]|uniref:Integrin alpha second immunoglobulin-like domain-containing protein n=1 Tax=Medioppia subpectinata TaxID=1979941 RepID=A0A7R9KW75_9ACAR|nr:unnamed protein product [Medioppia subpectinata]CAG2110873.1 unnamed protein product [Medioppia subpectinata]
MMGFSAVGVQALEKDENILLGAPGYRDFSGSVIRQWTDNREEQLELEKLLEVVDSRLPTFNSYLGYAITTGFFDANLEYVVIGAPRHRHFDGKVLIHPLSDFSERKRNRFQGYLIEVNGKPEAKGEYFGASLLALDINNDKFDDLIVGAPLYSTNRDRDIGRIYVFLMNDKGTEFIKEELISGHKSGGRFGSAMASSDINLDGYRDAIIGAPYESNSDGSMGAVYIYMGSELGLNLKFREPEFLIDIITAIEVKLSVQLPNESSDIFCKDCGIAKTISKYSGQRIERNLIEGLHDTIDIEISVINSGEASLNTEPEFLIDIITAIEVKLSVQLPNESSDIFCKDCGIAKSHSTFAYIDFEHGCQSGKCLSRLRLTAISKYSGQRIERNLIEGLHDTIDIEISVINSGEASLNTVVDIKMTPILLDLTNSAEADRCKPMTNTSSYRCEVSRILQKNSKENLNLHFIVARIPTNNIQIDFKVESSSDIEKTSKLTDSMNFEIIRKASLMIMSEATNNFSFSDKTPRVSFHVSYSLVKSGPSSIDSAFIELRLPHNIIVPDSNCDKNSDYCSKYLCRLPKFNSGAYSQPFTLSLSLIPSRIKDKNFNQIVFKLNSELKVEDKVKFETQITSFTSMSVYMARDVPIIDEKVEPWVLFLSAGFGVFILIITVIVLIRYGFFRRKKLEEIEKVKQRMSMRPDMYDINVLDLDDEDLDETSTSNDKQKHEKPSK